MEKKIFELPPPSRVLRSSSTCTSYLIRCPVQPWTWADFQSLTASIVRASVFIVDYGVFQLFIVWCGLKLERRWLCTYWVCVCVFDWFDIFEIFDGVCLLGCFLALSEFLPGMKKAAVIRFGAPMRGLQPCVLLSGRDQQWELWFFFDSSHTLYLCITEALICYVNTNMIKIRKLNPRIHKKMSLGGRTQPMPSNRAPFSVDMA